jgi:hypothetical protein
MEGCLIEFGFFERESMAGDFFSGEATTEKLLSGDSNFKMSLVCPQQTTPFAAFRACHPAA